jgi:RND family efflux transporter MFP subunit
MSEKGSRDEVNTEAPGAENTPAIARLCYVDDSRTSAYVVQRLLQPFGYQVDHFSSAEPAFVALVQEDYDLLLTDLKVSSKGMDGDDLIRTLRQSGHPKISAMPIIVITGATDAEALVSVYEAGANQVMKKPVDAEELDGHIRRLLFNGKRVEPTLAEVKPQKTDRPSSDATVVPLHAGQHTTQRPVRETEETATTEQSPTSTGETDIPVLKSEPADVDTSDTATQVSAEIESTAETEDSSILRAMEKESISTKQKDAKQEDKADEEAQANVVIDEPADISEEAVIIEPEMRNAHRSSAQSADNNILREIEQYPLVINPRKGLFSGSGLLNMMHSLVELVGLRRILLRTLAVGIALVALFFAWDAYFNRGIPVDTMIVESGEIFQSITVPGRVVSKQRVNVSSARAGRLVKILVKEGDKVKKGQVLAKLDDRELLSRLNRAKANLSAARQDVTLAQRTLKRLRKAHAKGAVARRFVEDAEVDLRSARTKAGIVEEEVSSATLDVEKQKVKAAFDGTITARFAEIGQWVGPTETLFTLVDESQREVEVRVDAADSVAIDVGQVVMMSSDAFPGLEWQESVVRLGAEAGGKRNANSVKVYVSLGNDAPVFRYGQQVDADIRTAWNPNTLKVPFESLISRDGHTMVAVLQDGEVRMKIVETGIEDFSMAEIKQGLNAGEMVILSKGQMLKNGDRVYPKRDKK